MTAIWQSDTDKKIEEVLTRLDNKEDEPVERFFFDTVYFIGGSIKDLGKRIVAARHFLDNRQFDKESKGLDRFTSNL